MGDWQDQLNNILSDPDAMAQIAALAQSLSGQGSADTSAEKRDTTGATSAPPPPPPENGGAPDFSALASMLGGLDPELLRRLAPLVQQLNRPESSQTAAFLRALRPFLSESRREKVERAAQLARLIHLAKVFLTTQGEDSRV